MSESFSRRFAIALLAAGMSSGPAVGAVSAQESFPVEGGAPYAAAVATHEGATIAVVGDIRGSGSSTEAAAESALATLDDRLDAIGLDRSSLVRVRAALAPGDGSEFDGWNAAWQAHFGDAAPARTTVGSSGVPGDALVVLDAVAVFPGEVEPTSVSGAQGVENRNIAFHGGADAPTAIVSTRGGLFLSSGALPGRNLNDPESLEEHMRSSLNSLGNTLMNHGLRWDDVFFVRSMPTPQPERTTPDFPAWDPVYESLQELAGHAPPFALWAAPGFGGSGRYSEIEVWAAIDGVVPAFSVDPLDPVNPLLRMTGSETGSIANGAVIAPDAELIFLSGVVAPAGTAPEMEAEASLAELENRLAAMGASVGDVAELRVYRVDAGDGVDYGGAWNDAYGARFNNPDTNPSKPVRTNYLVESLPGDRRVEVEVVVVRPPAGF